VVATICELSLKLALLWECCGDYKHWLRTHSLSWYQLQDLVLQKKISHTYFNDPACLDIGIHTENYNTSDVNIDRQTVLSTIISNSENDHWVTLVICYWKRLMCKQTWGSDLLEQCWYDSISRLKTVHTWWKHPWLNSNWIQFTCMHPWLNSNWIHAMSVKMSNMWNSSLAEQQLDVNQCGGDLTTCVVTHQLDDSDNNAQWQTFKHVVNHFILVCWLIPEQL